MRNAGPVVFTIVVLAVVAASLAASRSLRMPAPTPLADTGFLPSDMSEHDGWWYWTERPSKARVKLLRARANSKETVAEVDDIAGYSAAGGVIVWSARNGKQWSVMRRQDGHDETLWSGTDSAGAPSISEGSVVWAVTRPGLMRENVTLPALGPQTELMVSGRGVPVRTAGNLLESGCDIAGVHGDSAYAVCGRSDTRLQTAAYEVSLSTGAARRVFGEDGPAKAALLPSGELIWTAPSRDSSLPARMSSVRSLAPGKAIVTRADWLPPYGQLAVSASRVYYVTGEGQPGLWSITTNDELPRLAQVPDGYEIAAASDRAVILTQPAGRGNALHLYTWPLP